MRQNSISHFALPSSVDSQKNRCINVASSSPILSPCSLTMNSSAPLKQLLLFRAKRSHREHSPFSFRLTSYWEHTVKICIAQHAFKGEPEGMGFKLFLLPKTIGNVKHSKGLEDLSMFEKSTTLFSGKHRVEELVLAAAECIHNNVTVCRAAHGVTVWISAVLAVFWAEVKSYFG